MSVDCSYSIKRILNYSGNIHSGAAECCSMCPWSRCTFHRTLGTTVTQLYRKENKLRDQQFAGDHLASMWQAKTAAQSHPPGWGLGFCHLPWSTCHAQPLRARPRCSLLADLARAVPGCSLCWESTCSFPPLSRPSSHLQELFLDSPASIRSPEDCTPLFRVLAALVIIVQCQLPSEHRDGACFINHCGPDTGHKSHSNICWTAN